MRCLSFVFLLSLPFVVQCYHSHFGAFDIDSMSLIYRGVYVFGNKDASQTKKDKPSEISLDVDVKPRNDTVSLFGTVETIIASEDVFKNIGYTDSKGVHIACCDEDAYKRSLCKNQNSLIIPEGAENEYYLEKTQLNGKESTIKLSYQPPKTGIYYVLTAVCDYHISPMVLEGQLTVKNPYGHLPAPQYGSLPFFSVMCVVYIVALLVWCMLCYNYSKEIMSVQYIIIIVLISFVINNFVKVIYLTIFNKTGNNSLFLSLFSVFIDTTTRTLTRILALLVCMGLGVCRATIGNSACKFITFGISYFTISFWDSFFNIYPSDNNTIQFIRLFVTSAMDALVYFWIFQSLMNTMEELENKKQEAKLEIFNKLRNLLIASVVFATLTLVAFSYIIVYDSSHRIWKYQWFINEGIWNIYYFILFLCIMVMWKPSENTSAYAYHMQVATDIQENDEEYGLPNDNLVDSDEGEVVINTISNDMKPMDITETSA